MSNTVNANKITYIFGAGASCESIPIREDLTIDLANIFKLMGEFLPADQEILCLTSGLELPYKQLFLDLQENLIKLSESARKHASVDTLAKKLYLSDPNDFKKDFAFLKIHLSAYFAIKQLITEPDKRYDAFFASILDDAYDKLPDNFNILSWNYDKQFEITYAHYENNSNYRAKSKLHIMSKFSNDKYDDDKFKIIKLNGTAALLDRYQSINYLWDTNLLHERKKSFNHILEHYHYLISDPLRRYTALSFAWEQDFATESLLTKSKNSINNSDILIVVGYSFPFFNRKIDKEMLEVIAPKKIYIQDLDPESVISRIRAISPLYSDKKMEPYSNVNQFLIPYEF